MEGIGYYQEMFASSHFLEDRIAEVQNQLELYKAKIIEIKIPELVVA